MIVLAMLIAAAALRIWTDALGPTPSFVVTAIIVVMVLYVPSAVITAIHNRRYDGHALER
ncbi:MULTISPECIES: hypothetical protein [unclassified Rhodococcus (in: high G+C Gram-positive bacteria)]|uniref:hypothetical protein n=1 Tax=unclassified Rhodococcus (in: high G+C Gram-positive bacteria) TaxID=192944 RepID=UPI0012E3957C|nr:MULTISPECIES: hypothetical protein [unclassified Rhodococcus (in: high G+C Gram-positive bacteria)]